MSSKYYHLTVKEVIQETPDAVTISFWHPVHQAISYQAGQFLTIISEIGNQKIRRSYSMSSSPHSDAALAVTVKRVPNGIMSNYLNDYIKAGDALEVMEPMGHFSPQLVPNQSRHVVLFGAGSGITPLMSIAKSILTIEPNTKVFLVYGNRNQDTIIFKKQLEDLETKYAGRFETHHILSQPQGVWVGLKGRINEGMTVVLLKQMGVALQNSDYYLCGPEGMIQEVQKGLRDLSVSTDRIHQELFFSATDVKDHDEPEMEENSLKAQIVTINYEGNVYETEVKPHQTILEAFLDKDIDLPYSCQAGMCTACLGKCTTGKVMMDEEDGLTEKEIQQGYILTCVAHPMSKGVVIDIE
jgi:ring-1,2-phenylacetyl-CoA epoxidase subunit PaaE